MSSHVLKWLVTDMKQGAGDSLVLAGAALVQLAPGLPYVGGGGLNFLNFERA